MDFRSLKYSLIKMAIGTANKTVRVMWIYVAIRMVPTNKAQKPKMMTPKKNKRARGPDMAVRILRRKDIS
jgi:hypothetical protein